MKNIFTTARSFARRALVSTSTADGFVAGTHHFTDYWARDCLFATYGANVAGLTAVSRKTIGTFIRYQRRDGLIPYLVRRDAVTPWKYFGIRSTYKTPHPNFRSVQSGGIVPDGGLMTVIAAYALNNRSFIKKNSQQLERAMDWYETRFHGGLISEWFQCEWADAVLKRGNTLYTNVLYWKALGDMKRTDEQEKIGRLIRQALWNGEFFSDWKSIFRHDYFTAHANMLALVFGLATRQEAQKILRYAVRTCWNGWTLESNYPRYPYWRIPITNYLSGTADYHNRGCLWLQPGILYAVALARTGNAAEGKRVLRGIAEKIVERKGVFEVYEKNGTPVGRLLYRSETSFSWSAGLFLWASHILRV